MLPTDLAEEFRMKAAQFLELGAEAQARTLEFCANRLEGYIREWEAEPLTLQEAAEESGYAPDHLSRLIREGTLPSAGEPYAPRIRRKDLPHKPGHSPASMTGVDGPVDSRVQMARSVVESE